VTPSRAESWWARQAAERFGLPGRLRQVAAGIDSTFVLTAPDGERYAIRVGALPTRTSQALDAEATWIDRLAGNAHLRVPDVVLDRHGQPVVELTDGHRTRHAVALGWVPGRKARARFTRSHARRLGSALAALHLDARAHDDDPTAVKQWPPLLCGIGDLATLDAVAGPAASEVVRAAEARVADACASLVPDASGLVNRDIGPHNVVWDSGDPRPGLFDFNDTGWGPYTCDLARYVHSLAWRDQGDALVEAALDGYRTVAELPDGWDEYADLFLAACNLFGARYLAPQVGRRGPEVVTAVRRMVGDAAAVVDGAT
jgi:Ser/Thr protein kinase RdoA (MazF antagonist)